MRAKSLPARLAFVIFVMLLCAPALGRWFSLDPSPPLNGVESPEPLPAVTLASLWSGEYQSQLEKNVARGLGFRAALVRTDNQLNLSVFHELKPTRLLGQHDVLFDDAMHPRAEWWMAGAEFFVPMIRNLKTLDEQLRSRHIPLVIVISPNKSRLYPEDQPRGFVPYAGDAKVPTVCGILRAGFDALHFEVADFARIFAERNARGGPRVFGKGSFHWNSYGAALAASDILQRCARLSGQPWPDVAIESLDVSDEPIGVEGDLIDLANIWDKRRFWGGNPVVKLAAGFPGGAQKKRLLCVGSSFLWTLADTLTETKVLSRLEILFYFETRVVFKNGVGPREELDKGTLKAAKIDWSKELDGFDAVLLEIPEYACTQLGFGFTEAALRSMGIEPVR